MRLTPAALFVATCTCWLMVAPVAARAQRTSAKPKLGVRVGALESKLQGLQQSAADLATVTASLQVMTEQLAAVQAEIAVLRREQKSIPDSIASLDVLNARVEELAGAIVSLRASVGALTQPWAPEPSGQAGAGVKHKGGFGWATSDKRFSIKIGAYLHGRYQLALQDDPGVTEEVTFAQRNDLDSATLRIRRARFGVSGHLGSDKTKYKMLFTMIPKSGKPLLDFYVDYELRKDLYFRFGQYKTQFTRAFTTSSSRLAFPEAPTAIDAFRYDRDIGVGLHGRFAAGKYGYYAGLGNGAGANKVNDNIDMLAVVRLDAVALGERFKKSYGDVSGVKVPTLMVGGGVTYDLTATPSSVGGVAIERDVDGDLEIDNIRVLSASVDASFRYKGLEVAAEGVWRQESWGTVFAGNPALVSAVADVAGDTSPLPDTPDGELNYKSFFSQITYMVKPKRVLVGARAGYSQLPFLGVGGRSSSLRIADRLLELSAIAQLYNDRGQRSLGLQYTMNNYDASVGPDPAGDVEHRVVLEMQLKL